MRYEFIDQLTRATQSVYSWSFDVSAVPPAWCEALHNKTKGEIVFRIQERTGDSLNAGRTPPSFNKNPSIILVASAAARLRFSCGAVASSAPASGKTDGQNAVGMCSKSLT
jgi:hypothetical protein